MGNGTRQRRGLRDEGKGEEVGFKVWKSRNSDSDLKVDETDDLVIFVMESSLTGA